MENSLVIKLSKAYDFEGKSISEIDLSKLEDMTCGDLINIGKKYNKTIGGDITPMDAIIPEANIEYDFFVASETSGMPVEFFKGLSSKEAGRIKVAVINFFHSEE